MRREAHFAESLWFKGAAVDDVICAVLRREYVGARVSSLLPSRGDLCRGEHIPKSGMPKITLEQ
jgi:hypothetical protein